MCAHQAQYICTSFGRSLRSRGAAKLDHGTVVMVECAAIVRFYRKLKMEAVLTATWACSWSLRPCRILFMQARTGQHRHTEECVLRATRPGPSSAVPESHGKHVCCTPKHHTMAGCTILPCFHDLLRREGVTIKSYLIIVRVSMGKQPTPCESEAVASHMVLHAATSRRGRSLARPVSSRQAAQAPQNPRTASQHGHK